MSSQIKLILIVYLALNSTIACSQSRYNIIYEPQLGQTFAAENGNAGFHLFNYVDSLVIPKKIIKKDNNYAKVINPIYRFGKLFLTNYLITDFVMTMNHERFGHGYRILESEGGINEIVYNPPPPFSNEFSFLSQIYPTNYTIQQELMFRLGGSETNLVLTDITRKNMLLDEKFSYNFSLAYLYGSNDMPGYTAFVTAPAGDPNQYRNTLNYFYGEENLTRKKMRTYAFFNMLTDPLNFYAIKSVFYDYIIKGRGAADIKMIKLSKRLKYLPRFRFEYTPYGPELVYQNYFKLDSKLIQLNFSHADGSFDPSWRIYTKIWNIKTFENLSFSLAGQIWNQPLIDFFKGDRLQQSQGLGSEIIVTTNYDLITNEHLLGFTMQVGYKSSGYSLGEQLDKGLVARGGLTFKLGN
jgi:hypothetical protein